MKKIISAFTSIALLAGVAAMPVAAEETYALGDVTMDGKVDSMDAMEVLVHYSYVSIMKKEGTLTDTEIILGDVLQDGTIGLVDAVRILFYYAHTLVETEPVDSETYFANFEYYFDTQDDNDAYEDVAGQIGEELQDNIDNRD